MEGWIKLYRSVLGHRLFEERTEYDKRSAWIYLLLTANHKDGVVDDVFIKRGSMMTSIRKLSDVWRWSRTRVQTFLKECADNGEIRFEKHAQKMTIITIINYAKYQGNLVEIEFGREPAKEPVKEPHEKASLSQVNTGDSEVSRASQKSQIKSHEKSLNNNKDKELKDKNILSFYNDVVDFLNQTAGTKYKATVEKTKRCIHARVKEGFTLDDFHKVIIAKVSEWKDNPSMKQYIRPETLFGTKFESYLQYALKMDEAKKPRNVVPLYEPSDEERERYERIHRREML